MRWPATTGKGPTRSRRVPRGWMAIAAPRRLASTSWPRRRGGWAAWTTASSCERPRSRPSTSAARAGWPGSVPSGSTSTTASGRSRASPARGCGGLGIDSTATPSAPSTATSSCGRRRSPMGAVTSTVRPTGARQMVELGRRLRSPDLEAGALQTLGRVLVDQGEPEEGLGYLDEAMLSAVEGRLGPFTTGKVYCSLISACEELGDHRRAAEWTDATARWSERHPFALFPGVCRVHRAWALQCRGHWSRAEEESVRACAELAGISRVHAAAGFVELGEIRRRVGDLEGAEEAFREAEALCGRPQAGLALLRLAQGRVDAANAIIERAPRGGDLEAAGARQAAAGAGADRGGRRRSRDGPRGGGRARVHRGRVRPSGAAGRRRVGPGSPRPRGGRCQCGVRHPAPGARALAGPRRPLRGGDGSVAPRAGPARRR